MATTPSHLYVYYRVAADTAEARALIAALMTDVAARTGIRGRLLARCEDPSTWMEVYESIVEPAPFLRVLDESVTANGASRVSIDGRRTIERFCAIGPDRRESGARRG
ncbi:MAG: DUF4936 family protein [Betaproteobacteria bacterium]